MLKRNQLPLKAVQAMQKAMTMPGIDARTLLKIGLEAWPGMRVEHPLVEWTGNIILPLPQEDSDDK